MPRGVLVVAVVALVAAAWVLRAYGAAPVTPPGPLEERAGAPRASGRPSSDSSAPRFEAAAPRTQIAAPEAPQLERFFLEGVVLDEGGEPVARAWVTTADGARTRSDDRGRFRLTRSAAAAGPTRLLVTARGRRPARFDARWGGRGYRVTMSVAGLLALQVVDAATNLPVERFEAQIVAIEDGDLRPGPFRLRGFYESGLLEARVEVGSPALLRVLADDTGYAPSALYEVELSRDRPRVVRVSLSRWRTRPVKVSDSRGRPVGGAHVELLAAPPGLSVELVTEAVTAWVDHAGSRASLLATALTDARGRAILRAPADGTFVLRASHPDAGAAIRREVWEAPDGAASVELQLRR